MTTGLLLSVLTGLLWAIISCWVCNVSRKNYSGSGFYAIGTLLSALICFLVWLPSHEGWRLIPKLLGYFAIAASANAFSQLILMYGQKKKNCALFVSIGQSNFVWSFVMMALFFGDKVEICNIIGLILIICAFITAPLLNSRTETGTSLIPSAKDVALAVLCAVLGGVSSVTILRAGRIEEAPVILKTGLQFICGTAFHIANILISKQHFSMKEKMFLVKYGTVWTVLAIASYVCLFKASEYLAPFGRAGMIHVIANSLNMFLFWMYSVIFLKTGTSKIQIALMSLIIIGLIIFKLG